LPAPIDISAALGSPVPEDVPSPAPGGGGDYFTDPLAGLAPAEGEEMEAEMSEDPDMALCQELFPEWMPDQHDKLLQLIDSRLAMKDEPADDADQD
jgi:hypothetical protein